MAAPDASDDVEFVAESIVHQVVTCDVAADALFAGLLAQFHTVRAPGCASAVRPPGLALAVPHAGAVALCACGVMHGRCMLRWA